MICSNCGGEDFTVQKTNRSRNADGKFDRDCDMRVYMCGRFGDDGKITGGCGISIRVACRKVDLINASIGSLEPAYVDPSEVRP